MKRTLVAVALAVVFVLALAAPALAQAIYHTATYEMEGVINFKKQGGHFCNTGAEVKQTIMGSGKMDKTQTITQVKGKISMDDNNSWVAGATPLTVTTVWKLCTPPKYTYMDPDNAFTSADGTGGADIPVNIAAIYTPGDITGLPVAVQGLLTGTRVGALRGYNQPASYIGGAGVVGGMQRGYTQAQLASYMGWEAVSDQYWAVQVQADPGFSGAVTQKGEAAYGAYWGDGSVAGYDAGWTDYPFNYDDTWRWEDNKAGTFIIPTQGKKYVGDYFHIAQMARTSQGTLKRYIDISSPWSHGYLHEDMSVVGKSMVQEGFKLDNLPPGSDVPKDWWKLF